MTEAKTKKAKIETEVKPKPKPKTVMRRVGFCGADDSVSPRSLGVIFNSYPFVEFGVLFRPDKEGEPRYASEQWVKELGKVTSSSSCKMTLAAHLCGSRVNDLLDGKDEFISTLYPLGFRRVQINATAVNGVDTSNLSNCVDTLVSIMKKYETTLEFIIQKNDETQPLWEGIVQKYDNDTLLPKNMTMLVDESKGTGVMASSWPVPPDNYDIGYAGGIGPDNISTVIKNIMTVADGRSVWIDMESSLRTIEIDSSKGGGGRKDVFDLNKVFQCIDAVCDAGIYDHPEYVK